MINLEIGGKYTVKIIRLVKVGAVVELEDRSQGLIHVSRISSNFVSDVGDFVSIGETYEALGVEGTARPVELSIRHLNLHNKNKVLFNDKTLKPKVDNVQRVTIPKSTPNVEPKEKTSNLDDMIARCNRSYEEKFGKGSLNKSQGQQPRRRRSR